MALSTNCVRTATTVAETAMTKARPMITSRYFRIGILMALSHYNPIGCRGPVLCWGGAWPRAGTDGGARVSGILVRSMRIKLDSPNDRPIRELRECRGCKSAAARPGPNFNDCGHETQRFAMEKMRILIVDDEPILAHALARSLANLGYTIAGKARSGEQAFELVLETRPDLVLMDIELGAGMNGIEAAVMIKADRKSTRLNS